MSRVTQLGYLGLSVADLGAFERFATEILGLAPNGRTEDGSLFLRMDAHNHRFVVHPTGKDDVAYVGWEVVDERALDALAENLVAAGTRVERGSKTEAEARRVAGLVRFVDPNGIATEVSYGALVLADDPFRSPRPISGFKASEQGFGHCVLAVDDFRQSLCFYRDVMGLRVSDFIRYPVAPGVSVDLAFLHCNARHHSLAFAVTPGAPKRMHHFMLQLESLDDVGLAYALCQERRVPIVMTLGRHTNDRMVSFYAETPAGFAVEYGWGAREIDADWHVRTYTAGSIWGHLPGGTRP